MITVHGEKVHATWAIPPHLIHHIFLYCDERHFAVPSASVVIPGTNLVFLLLLLFIVDFFFLPL